MNGWHYVAIYLALGLIVAGWAFSPLGDGSEARVIRDRVVRKQGRVRVFVMILVGGPVIFLLAILGGLIGKRSA